jgi:glycosyltransferase involved in cell wall biosynthesis
LWLRPSVRFPPGRLKGLTEANLSSTASKDTSRQILAAFPEVQGVFYLETLPSRAFLEECRRRGVLNVSVPMWEWFPVIAPIPWDLVDLFICPCQMCLRVVGSYGFKNAVYLPWCLDLTTLPKREVSGPARLFLHNVGLLDANDRKGTIETIRAFEQTKRSDIRLLVHMQEKAEVASSDPRIEIRIGHLEHHGALFSKGEVAIQPSKMEGIGFTVLEAVACGLPVITLDYPPMNEWVRDHSLLIKKRWFKRRAFPTQWVKHAHLRLPSVRDLRRKIEWCAEQPLDSISHENRTWAEQEFATDRMRLRWQQVVTDRLLKA